MLNSKDVDGSILRSVGVGYFLPIDLLHHIVELHDVSSVGDNEDPFEVLMLFLPGLEPTKNLLDFIVVFQTVYDLIVSKPMNKCYLVDCCEVVTKPLKDL